MQVLYDDLGGFPLNKPHRTRGISQMQTFTSSIIFYELLNLYWQYGSNNDLMH